MKNIKSKMAIVFGSLVFLICLGMSLISYYNAKSALVSNVSKTYPTFAEEIANTMYAGLQSELKLLDLFAKTDEINKVDSSREEIINAINKRVEGESIIDVAVIKNNEYIGLTDTKLSDFSDISFYNEALAGNSNVSSVITNNKTGELVVVYAVPIINNNEVIGVLINIKDGLSLSNIIDKFKLGTSGKAFVINNEGTTIASGITELVINKDNVLERAKKDSDYASLAEIEKKMINGKSGYDVYSLDGKGFYLGYAPIKDTTWSAAVLIEQNEILSELNALKITSIMLFIIYNIIGFVVAYLFARYLSKRIKNASDQIMSLAEGNLSIEPISDKYRYEDEVTVMVNSMNTMHEALRNIISKVKLSSDKIDLQSESLSEISSEIAASSQSVAEAIASVTEGTTEQSENTGIILQILDEFSNKLLVMVNEVKDIDLSSRQIGEMAHNSSKDMDTVNESVRDISESFKEFYTKVTNLGKDVNKVNEITNLINSIADQTNLLALNAAIEAARAGEAGKGFSIVADEIRMLAEQTKQSSENISSLIEEVSNNTNIIVKESVDIDNKLMNQVENINKSIHSFTEIINGVDVIVPKIEEVRNSAENINREKENIINRVDKLSSSAMDISASSEEISASSQEMNASTEEVSAAADVLNQTTKEMINEVNKFIL